MCCTEQELEKPKKEENKHIANDFLKMLVKVVNASTIILVLDLGILHF